MTDQRMHENDKRVYVNRLIMLNQMAGPLFRELAEDLAPLYKRGCLLVTGHAHTLATQIPKNSKLVIKSGPQYNRSSKLRRVISWLSYVLMSSKYILAAKPGDAILLVSNPPILGFWVWLLTKFNNVPYSVLVYDIYPEVLVQLGRLNQNGLIVKVWHSVNRLVNENAQLVITIGKRMAGVINKNNSVATREVVTISPWVDVQKIKPIKRSDNPYANEFTVPQDQIVILYSGNMGLSHDIDSMLEAARTLSNEPGLKFIFIGDGDKRKDIQAFIQSYELKNIALFPFQPESMIRYSLPIADISLVSLDQGMENLMVPSKSLYYLAAGSALIGIANKNSELSDIIEHNDCGLIVEPRKPDALVRAIKSLISNPDRLTSMKIHARLLAERKYSRDVCTHKFSEYLRHAKLL